MGKGEILPEHLHWADPDDVQTVGPNGLSIMEERFCQAYVASFGKHPIASYVAAFQIPPYDAETEPKKAAIVRAQVSILRKKPHVVARIIELQQRFFLSVDLTRNRIHAEILSIQDEAREAMTKALASDDPKAAAAFMKAALKCWEIIANMGGYTGKFANVNVLGDINVDARQINGTPLSIEELASRVGDSPVEDYEAVTRRLSAGETASSEPPEDPSPPEPSG